jgi:YbbR domain-containing protein
MVSRWFLIFFMSVFLALFLWVSISTAMNPDCSRLEDKSVKVEVWMSKQYEKAYGKYAINFLQWEIHE